MSRGCASAEILLNASEEVRFSTFALPVTSEFAMYIREQVISGALLTETRSTAYEDLTSKALLRCLVAVGS